MKKATDQTIHDFTNISRRNDYYKTKAINIGGVNFWVLDVPDEEMLELEHGVYIHIFDNGKAYAGKTATTMKERWKIYSYSNQRVHYAMKKHSFISVVVALTSTTKQQNKIETQVIALLGGIASKSNYNYSLGGDAGSDSSIPVELFNLDKPHLPPLQFSSMAVAHRKLKIPRVYFSKPEYASAKDRRNGYSWWARKLGSKQQPPTLYGQALVTKKHQDALGTPVVLVNLETHEETPMPGISKAARLIGADHSQVYKVLHGEIHSTQGYWVKYPGQKTILPTRWGTKDSPANVANRKPVYATCIKTGKQEYFVSRREACEILNERGAKITRRAIYGCLNKNTGVLVADNYFFSEDPNEKAPTLSRYERVALTRGVPVEVFEAATGKLLGRYDSAKSASLAYGKCTSFAHMHINRGTKQTKDGLSFRFAV